MQQQKSYSPEQKGGTLYLIPTPIGNLEDMTFRAIRILKEVDYIAAEDTRQTKKLCNHFDIPTPIKSYHEHNKESKGKQIIEDLQRGQSIGLVSDAGMPCISDPGYELVALAVKENQTVVPLPGANAALTALTASGLSTDHFYFYGFLHRQKKQKTEELQELKYRKETIIFYEAPHRLKETLKLMNDVWGNRQIVLSRELTKRYEEFLRGSISEAFNWASTEEVRGEFCLIVEGSKEEEETEKWWENKTLIEHVDYYINEKACSPKEAIKQVAVERDVPKRDVYNAYHIE
ncbi:16S rRNA (cytidine(1402)-2'-O)-methyltransferase [Metabacillus iocasae]|uniref:Ribosomal RNA small subunit methyltransferase I n=1 Tax=Priestia iocasae TaxID=2291674 RepID=A0ABS2R2G9_9BACI|nr:16S rRNA (cytidine(1402)-2'-O)-methyltransferase [Metabacillus iocasae]MBM7704929.1 16S rRNA (cytidine1402-2'-O)-methyltransferase [Metabacillus iocasae]